MMMGFIDLEDGDANELHTYFPEETFDFIHSSHSLEHMIKHPWETIANWSKVLKPGGWVCITVPDFMMYEKGMWPSRFNGDHKWAFHTNENAFLSIVVDMNTCKDSLQKLGFEDINIIRITDNWNPNDPSDQTYIYENNVECAWEIIAKKVK
jgi:predicted SAM-dependent methyltransferase